MDSSRHSLLRSPLFQNDIAHLSQRERTCLSYKRAQAIGRLYGLTPDDLLQPSKKYWDMHSDPMVVMDGAVITLLTIQYNLCCGTLAIHAPGRQDIADVLGKLLSFEINGQYCLTELHHGLDAINLETTATLQANGTFILNTPHPGAAKYMPPTAPSGIPCVAIVFARLIVDGEDRGIRPFFVSINDGVRMSPGVVSKVLPPRGGADHVEHCITSFVNTRLHSSALLGTQERQTDQRNAFFTDIDRVIVGSLSMAAISLPALKLAGTIVAQYSKRRKVTDARTRLLRPIISFSTQQIPILAAISQALVFESCLKFSIGIFTNPETSRALRHCIAAIAKVTLVPQSQAVLLSLSERCGAQGLFGVNQIITMHSSLRGSGIAEGDVLALAIRTSYFVSRPLKDRLILANLITALGFATEILLGRVVIPPPIDVSSILARHEISLIQELRGALIAMSDHRNAHFERLILPRCQPLLEAVGHRIAYEAALQDHLDDDIVNLYVASCFKADSGWYTEHGGIPLVEQRALETESVTRLSPRLEELIKKLDVDEYVMAPIISEEKWNRHVEGLATYRGSPTSSELATGESLISRL